MANSTKWSDWVQKEAHEKPEQRPLKRGPASPVIPSTNSSTTTTTLSPSNTNPRLISPTTEQISAVLPTPVQCFCGKKAYRTYTSEYGPVLVCSNFELDPAAIPHKMQSKYVCGFHVHETSWTKFCDTLKATNHVNLDYIELRSCPLYNFTFCAVFRTSNKFDLKPPIVLPKCFCHNPVTMRIGKLNGSISFACKNGDVDGAKKCSWILPAHQVAFPRPKFHIHNCISHDNYMEKKHSARDKLASDQSAALAAASSAEGRQADISAVAHSAEGHQADLLATLARPSDNVDTASDSVLHQPKPTGTKSLIIPTCVMAKRPTSQPVLSRSSSASSCSMVTSPVMTNSDPAGPNNTLILANKMEEHQQLLALKCELSKVRNENAQLKYSIHTLTTNVEDLTAKADRLRAKTSELQTDLHRSKNEHTEQNVLNIFCQERLSKIEMDVVNLMNDNEKLKEEVLVMLEEKAKSGKDEELNKCRLCFTRNIEYCLIPCYHYAYCQLCAQKLTECAICRTEILNIQKIYSC